MTLERLKEIRREFLGAEYPFERSRRDHDVIIIRELLACIEELEAERQALRENLQGALKHLNQESISMHYVKIAVISRDTLKALEADKARLDWIQTNDMGPAQGKSGDWMQCVKLKDGVEVFRGATARAAIDAARQPATKGEGK